MLACVWARRKRRRLRRRRRNRIDDDIARNSRAAAAASAATCEEPQRALAGGERLGPRRRLCSVASVARTGISGYRSAADSADARTSERANINYVRPASSSSRALAALLCSASLLLRQPELQPRPILIRPTGSDPYQIRISLLLPATCLAVLLAPPTPPPSSSSLMFYEQRNVLQSISAEYQ